MVLMDSLSSNALAISDTSNRIQINRTRISLSRDVQSKTIEEISAQSLAESFRFFNKPYSNRTTLSNEGLPAGLFAGKHINILA